MIYGLERFRTRDMNSTFCFIVTRPWRNETIFTWAFISSEMILSLKQFDGNILHALASNSFYQTKNL